MKKILILCFIITSICSCKTQLIVMNYENTKIDTSKEFLVLHNDNSIILKNATYPPYWNIDQFVKKSEKSEIRIDSLIYREFIKRKLKCSIIYDKNMLMKEDMYLIKYQDYWTWDFKRYMHMLIIYVNDFNKYEKIKCISQGNMLGLHQYPMPVTQVPALINELFK